MYFQELLRLWVDAVLAKEAAVRRSVDLFDDMSFSLDHLSLTQSQVSHCKISCIFRLPYIVEAIMMLEV